MEGALSPGNDPEDGLLLLSGVFGGGIGLGAGLSAGSLGGSNKVLSIGTDCK